MHPIRFPGKRDHHVSKKLGKGWFNWWELEFNDIYKRKGNRAEEKEKVKKEISIEKDIEIQ